MSRIKRGIGSAVAAVVVIGGLVWMYTTRLPDTEAGGEEAMTLPVVAVTAREAVIERVFPVTIEGEMDVEIRPQVEGTLDRWCVKEGDYVAQGTLLFAIDDSWYRQQLHAAEADLAVAEAGLERAVIDVDRNRNLTHSGVISEIQLRTIQADHKQAVARVQQNRAAVESARIRLDYTRVKAPVGGVVGRLPYRKGSLVGPSMAEPLTMLSAVDRVRARLSVSERDYVGFVDQQRSHPQPITLILADGTTHPHPGQLWAVNGSFDRQTGSVAVWVEFPNPERSVRSGNTGSVVINKQIDRALLIPQKATFRRQDKTLVYLLDDERRVKSHVIGIEGESDGQWVVTSGLNEGDLILLSGLNKVTEGMKIGF